MCGFTGIISTNNKATIDFSLVDAMNQRIAHRGPDDWGIFLWNKEKDSIGLKAQNKSLTKLPFLQKQEGINHGNFALGHRRLAIQDLSELGHQPMSDETGRYWLVFNGEIFNFKKLKKDLLKQGVSFFSNSDSEVLLKGYIQYGKDVLNKLDGFYAFIIFDKQTQDVFAARDTTGVKPFYYLNLNSEWYLGSEVKCFYDLAGANFSLDTKSVQDYLLHGKIEVNNRTFYQDIKQLMPGEILEFNFKQNEVLISPFPYSKPYLEQNLKDYMVQSIKNRLVSDVPIGFAVSGGIDSTILTTVAKTFEENALNLFSSNSNDKKSDESYWQDIVHQKVGGNWFKTDVDTDVLPLEYINYMQDCPVLGANNIAHFQMNKTVKDQGVKVFLNGQGADELFAGYPYYYAHYYLFASKKEKNELLENLENAPLTKKELKRFILKIKLEKYIPKKWWSKLLLKRKAYSVYLKDSLMEDSEYLKVLPQGNLQDVLTQDFYGQRLREMLHWEDRNTMAYGIESRNPFADDRALAHLALNLPDNEKIHKGWSKYFLRREFEEYIPKEIATRVDKKGFTMPDVEWSRRWKVKIKSSLNNPKLDEYLHKDKLLTELDTLMESNDIIIHQFLFRVMSLSVFLNLDKSKHYEMVS